MSTIQAFGSKAETNTLCVCLVSLIDNNGALHQIKALEKHNLNLNIPPVPQDVAQRWRECGIQLVSDTRQHSASKEAVAILTGADYSNHFLKEKVEEEGEVAYSTVLAWVLSGPHRATGKSDPEGATIQANKVMINIQVL